MARNGNLSAVQRRAIAALLTERDVRAAAKVAKVGERTLHRWLGDKAFQAALKDAEAAAIDATIRRLSELTGEAVSVLRDTMQSNTSPVGAKLRAADVTLSRLLQLKELGDLEERLAAIEAALKVGTHGNTTHAA